MTKPPSEKTIFHHLEAPILVVNRHLEVIHCNEAVLQFWERDSKKIIGNHIATLFPKNCPLLLQLKKVFQEKKRFTINGFSLNIWPHRSRVVNVSMNPILKKSHNMEHALLTFHDVTDPHQIQEKEKEKAVLDAMGGFVSTIAHEIQNPLSGIKGVAQLLQRELLQTGISIHPTEMILKELGRIDRLVKELLLHSQPIPLEYTAFNVHELLNTVVWFEKNATSPPLQIQRQFDPSLPEIEADRDKLHQVFLNLLKNAREASPQNQEIIIRSSYCPKWEVAEKHLDFRREYFRVDIEDQGMGVAATHRDHIFKPLFTTKKQGSGLGLSISFRIIAEHGGLLQYQPALEQGSIFQVYIPRTPPLCYS